ncbi:MAG: ATP-binding protein [Archangium sp.]|nr:ATP-binding protein [Archangium sp.]
MTSELRLIDSSFFARLGVVEASDALGGVGVGVCELDQDARVEWMSPFAAKLLGTSPEAARGLFMSDLVHLDPDAVHLWPNASVARLMPVRVVHASARLVLVVEDHDHRGLLTQLELNHAAVEAAGNAIVITNRHGIIEYVNPAFTRMTGYTSDEAVGQHTRLLKSGHQDTAFYQVLWATLNSGAAWNGTFVNRKKDGSLYTEEATITPIDGADEVTHFVAVKRDVTVQRRLEDVAARGERLETIGELTVSVAHDLANVLSPIVTAVAFLQSGDASPAEQTEAITEIEESTNRATVMMRQMVGFARGAQGVRAPINTSRLLASYARELQRNLPPQVTFEVVVPEGLPTLVVDSLQLYQVLLNLTVNAIDAMPRGGSLSLVARPCEQGVELAVRDTGSGIPTAVLAHLFEPFFTTRPAGRGTGLGLATVKRITETHGGSVRVESEPGQGSTFTVTLPLVAPPVSAG